MRQAFSKAFGELEDKYIPSKEYIEKKLNELESGEFRAEQLSEVVGRDEVDPDTLLPAWDSKGHITVKKASSTVAMPTGPEQLRHRITVMFNALAMIKLRHVNRTELSDVTSDIFNKCKDYLLGDYVYGLRSADGVGSAIPPWTLVLGYDHAIRKLAYKLVSQEGYKLGEALKKAWKDPTVKERHFITPLALYSSRPLEPWSPWEERARITKARARERMLSRGRARPEPRRTSRYAFDTILRVAARRAINATSLMFVRYALPSAPATSARPARTIRKAQPLPDQKTSWRRKLKLLLQTVHRPPGRVCLKIFS